MACIDRARDFSAVYFASVQVFSNFRINENTITRAYDGCDHNYTRKQLPCVDGYTRVLIKQKQAY